MPELPEVEAAARSLARWAGRCRLRAIDCSEPRSLDGAGVASLRVLPGTRLTTVERLGKNLLLTFTAGRGKGARVVGAWSHLGMTGKWVRRRPVDAAPRFSRLRLDFEGAVSLHFVDMRLFGFFRVVPAASFSALPAIAALGPDPLREGIDVPRLISLLARRRRLPVKVAIMDQALLPGVGNIQASEGLHRASIDPRRAASSLTSPEAERLARALLASFRYTLRTLERAQAKAVGKDIEYVEEPGTRNPFKVYDRAGERCSRCKRGTIVRLVQAGRSTYFCPAHQR